ncbi:MAG: pectate lyase [Alistipes sp.]|nr:pectate lyase [Alistipes sp.]
MSAKKLIFTLLGVVGMCCAEVAAQPTFPVSWREGRLVYETDAQGNRLPDYSYCGYRNSNEAIPDLPVVVRVAPVEGDNSVQLQRAIDYVASLTPTAEGWRGAVLLEKGTYALDTPLWIRTSGVVLRGVDKEQTVLFKRGVDRGAVIYIEGKDDRHYGEEQPLEGDYLPLNECSLQVASSAGITVGATVRVRQEAVVPPRGRGVVISEEMRQALGIGNVNMAWERTVVAVEGNRVTLSSPLSMALDLEKRKSYIAPYTWGGCVEESGVEHLTILSDYDASNPIDENHAWTGVSIDAARNCWVRQVDFRQLAGSAVALQPLAAKITVEDCQSSDPISELAGSRRRTFLTLGQETLFQRCYSVHGQHDFSAGIYAPGPNAFVQCDSYESKGFSGSTGSWACALLFDVVNIDGHDLCFKNLERTFQRAGWNTANSLFWQCTAAGIECYSPSPEAQNYAAGSWATCVGNGLFHANDEFVRPRSLFLAQLSERIGKERAEAICRLYDRNTTATSSPQIHVAVELAKQAYEERMTMPMWIARAPFTASVESAGVPMIDEVKFTQPAAVLPAKQHYAITNGRYTADGRLLVGGRQSVRWWSGSLQPQAIRQATDHITRFVPDREGHGLTDRIDSVILHMKQRGSLLIDHNYGLWYDRRRDDHIRVRRRDADVWAPHYEQPFARSGQGTAWEGMSLYDLTKPNTWYWSRLKEFADKAEREGLVLFHQNYFQHNILEAGAHWVDSPWRSTNNINNTGFPEPTNFAGDKRIFVAQMFYDVEHPVRRALHRNYIRMCLDHFAENRNVVHLISEEYTGPLHFTQFWIDCIAEWEAETGNDALVALSTTKDVQDAILADPVRSKVIDMIDIRYWHHRADGTTYEPEGGKSMAPRQFARVMKVGQSSFASVYRAVSEYRTQYPEKAVTYSGQAYPQYAWAVVMAGGSCPVLRVEDETLLKAVPMMTEVAHEEGLYRLSGENGALIYLEEPTKVQVALPKGSYAVKQIDARTGEVKSLQKRVKVAGELLLDRGAGIFWIEKL